MASGGDDDSLCREFFRSCVVKSSVGKKLSKEEEKLATTKAVKKVLTDGLGANSKTISMVDASVFPKYQNQKKMVSEDAFVENMLKDIAKMELKDKKKPDTDDACAEEVKKMKKKIADKCRKDKEGGGGPKDAAVVSRLTDTSKYTGAHKERFGADGKGKGIDGREDRHENKGYVGAYKGEGTFDKKK